MLAKGKIKNCFAKMKESERSKNDIRKAASLIPDDLPIFQIEEDEYEYFDSDYPMNPFPNEHAARLLDPKKTKKDRVRRTHGSGDGKVQGVSIPTSIDIIWFIEEKGEDDIIRAQSLRFPTKKWTESKVKKWLKDHDIKYILFEPASDNTSDIINMEVNMTEKEIKEKYPELYEEIYNLGAKSIQDNIEAHAEWFDVAPKDVIEAIKNNEQFSTKHASKYAKAQLIKGKIEDRISDNPSDISTPDSETINEEDTKAHAKKLLKMRGIKNG